MYGFGERNSVEKDDYSSRRDRSPPARPRGPFPAIIKTIGRPGTSSVAGSSRLEGRISFARPAHEVRSRIRSSPALASRLSWNLKAPSSAEPRYVRGIRAHWNRSKPEVLRAEKTDIDKWAKMGHDREPRQQCTVTVRMHELGLPDFVKKCEVNVSVKGLLRVALMSSTGISSLELRVLINGGTTAFPVNSSLRNTFVEEGMDLLLVTVPVIRRQIQGDPWVERKEGTSDAQYNNEVLLSHQRICPVLNAPTVIENFFDVRHLL